MRSDHSTSFAGGSSRSDVTVLTPSVIAIVMASGAVAGCLGALLGLGGGVFLVPFLNAWFGLDFKTAAAISLVTVTGWVAYLRGG